MVGRERGEGEAREKDKRGEEKGRRVVGRERREGKWGKSKWIGERERETELRKDENARKSNWSEEGNGKEKRKGRGKSKGEEGGA